MQDSITLPDSNGVTFLANTNKALAALNSNHSGNTEPTNEVTAGKTWFDSLLNKMKFRNAASDGWKTVVTEDTLGSVMASSIHTAVSEEPGDTDEFGFYDSLTGLLRRVSLLGFVAKLKTYFDVYYGAKTLLAEYIVASDLTSIDFSGLDINTHKSYRIEVEAIGSTAGAQNISLFINNNTTAANYYRQFTTKTGTGSPTTTISNNSILSPHSGIVVLSIDFDIKLMAAHIKIKARSTENNINDYDTVINPQFGAVNITQLTFVHSAVGGFSAGSKIRIYRGDV